jgi:hypothetical protein
MVPDAEKRLASSGGSIALGERVRGSGKPA